MDVQIVCDQNDFVSLRKIFLNQLAKLPSQGMSGAILADGYSTPTRQRFTDQQKIGAAFAFIIVILMAACLTRLWQYKLFSLRLQFLALLVQADHGLVRIIGSLVHRQYIFHLRNETRAYFGNTPTLDHPRPQFVFFSSFNTQVSEICSVYPKATIRSANSWQIGRASCRER